MTVLVLNTCSTSKSRQIWHSVIGLVMVLSMLSCGFSGPDIYEEAYCNLYAELTDQVITNADGAVIQTGNPEIYLFHGYACGESRMEGREVVIQLPGNHAIPFNLDATVILNGWEFEYLGDDDQHLALMGVVIKDIKISGQDTPSKSISWKAIGAFGDQDFDDAYKFCYTYTVIAWNPSSIDLVYTHETGNCNHSTMDLNQNYAFSTNDRSTTALHTFAHYMFDRRMVTKETIGIFPQGFMCGWTGWSLWGNDHHLLQHAYSAGEVVPFVEEKKKYSLGFYNDSIFLKNYSRIDSGDVSWSSSGIIKDNDFRRGFGFGEVVTLFGGNDVRYIHPQFSILPVEDSDATSVSSYNPPTTQHVLNISHEYAIPILTGWDLQFSEEDEHVKGIGISIEEWSYDRPTSTNSGKLHYKVKSRLEDKDQSPSHLSRYRISILLIKQHLYTGGGSPFQNPNQGIQDTILHQ